MFGTSKPTPDDSATHPGQSENANRCMTSATLFGDASIVRIWHEGDTYVLRKTRNGKLILTK